MLQPQSLKNDLITLKLTLDKAITNGESYEVAKNIYSQMRSIEREIEKLEAEISKRKLDLH